ncbi:MAG: hypothetical protein LBD01_02220, partial [Puniceicoccales bacterium]|nr:hypothetical protein [Puniceicoccales bacterium]
RSHFLEYYYLLSIRNPNLREQSVVFLESLSKLGLSREEVDIWHIRFAQIKEKRDRPKNPKTTSHSHKKKT